MKSLKAHIAVLSANIIYGINYSVAKMVMPTYIKPFGFIFLRVIGALGLFWMVDLFLKSERIEKKDYIRFALCGLFGVAINQLLFFQGLNITTPINASIIMTSNPILVLVAALIILKERINSPKLLGIFLGISGALYLILSDGRADFESSTAIGDLFVFINSTSYGVYLVIVKPLMAKYRPLTVIKYVFLSGFVFVFGFGFNQFNEIDWFSMPLNIYWAIAFVVIGTTFFSYLLNIYALKKLSPTVVSSYIYSQPVIATLVALIIGMDSLDYKKIISTLLIFAGVYLVSKKH